MMTTTTEQHPIGDPEPGAIEASAETAPKPSRRWKRWAVPVGTLVVGLIIGVVAGSGDPTKSEQYQAQTQKLESAESQLSSTKAELTTAEQDARDAQSAAREAETKAAERNTELDSREAALVAREQAVTAAENTIKANSIGEGTWTVGVDIEPGTYRTSAAIAGDCYWAIYRSGSNGSDIIDNDIPTGGFPTVTLSEGQDFKNRDCGIFVKQ
jgi:hypothetical protein